MDKNRDYKLLKAEAAVLRKQGLSYGEIRSKLMVSKGTLSLWLKTVKLTSEQRQRLYTKQTLALNTGPQSQKNRRQREIDGIIKLAKAEIKFPISLASYRLFGAALYWAEGSKNQMFNITNSDPNLILFWVRWLSKIFKLPAKELKARLNIYPQQNETQLKKFWSDLTGIPLKNFGKSYVKPVSKNFKKNNLYYGTIRIEAPKSTDFRYRVYGWLKVVLEDIAPKVAVIEKKWEKLRAVSKPVNLV
jgi:hypothetical protein